MCVGCREFEELEVPYETARARVLIGRAYRALGDEDGARMELRNVIIDPYHFGGSTFPSPAHLWGSLMTSNPVRRMLDTDLTDAHRSGVQAVLADTLRERTS